MPDHSAPNTVSDRGGEAGGGLPAAGPGGTYSYREQASAAIARAAAETRIAFVKCIGYLVTRRSGRRDSPVSHALSTDPKCSIRRRRLWHHGTSGTSPLWHVAAFGSILSRATRA